MSDRGAVSGHRLLREEGQGVRILAYLTFGQTKLKMRLLAQRPDRAPPVPGGRLPGPGTPERERGKAGNTGRRR